MAADPIKAHFSGTAGQSFGVWNAGGVELTLTGDANDYVGKGMAGGSIAVRPPIGSAFRSHEASIVGNTCLYGATGGKLFAAGRAGERFAVRNSGAITVVEGIGDNGCEYMTGGIVCVLGKTGINFGAGMTGGFAYVLDEDGEFRKRVNPELVEVLDVDQLAIHEEHLRGLITEHVQATGSSRAEEIPANWPEWAPKFAPSNRSPAMSKRCWVTVAVPQPSCGAGAVRGRSLMSQNVYQFIDLQRVDPPKKPLKIRKIEFVEIYEPFSETRPRPGRTAVCPAATRIASGSARCTTTSRTG